MPIYAVTIFISAFLLFLVQPIIAKQILPWFGGSAAVWTTCLVFFQCMLLAGYLYADALTRCRPRTQAVVHTALLLVACALLPIVPDAAWKPIDAADPTPRILMLLSATIGLPYFLVSTTGPLVQSWFARAYAEDERQRSVYRLFALSNLASLIALMAYPFTVEPYTTVREQSVAWSYGFAVFAALATATAWVTTRRIHQSKRLQSSHVVKNPMDHAPSLGLQLLWLMLAALGTLFLLSVTTHITQNIASVPFLWIVPLALYLLTFILCFDGRGWYRRSVFWPALLVVLPLMAWGLVQDRGVMHISQALPLYCLGLFVVCMFCHGELVHAKPSPRWLTRFYLMISLGGALGGLFVGLVAPRVFAGYWELPLALVGCALLATIVITRVSWLGFGVAALISASVASWFGWQYLNLMRTDALLMTRNFYGTLRVKQTAPDDDPHAMRRLMHGVIMHGEQSLDAGRRDQPTTYYGPTSGAGLALQAAPERPRRIGVIGLGVGTVAAYARPHDVVRFYEINPQVLDAATRYFTYLPRAAGTIETVLGDARLNLERESPQAFDVLIVDAFSSDSIPVHLMTREALAIYRRHLAPSGVVAFHVTNRYLSLAPVVKQLADDARMHAVLIADTPVTSQLSTTDYVLVAEKATPLLVNDEMRERATPIEAREHLRLWTDDYNNLSRILK
ncbi:MAG TPA: fused MFS/spermidine synthase [Burkholderiaceae bacterium]|nr:fused MFS/spermidine synthase [Burkholderiaceae bacterium]